MDDRNTMPCFPLILILDFDFSSLACPFFSYNTVDGHLLFKSQSRACRKTYGVYGIIEVKIIDNK